MVSSTITTVFTSFITIVITIATSDNSNNKVIIADDNFELTIALGTSTV